MRWSDKSVSPAPRWWDRVARQHGRRGWKIPVGGRSFFFLYNAIIRAEAAMRRHCGRLAKDEFYIRDGVGTPPPNEGQSRSWRASSRRLKGFKGCLKRRCFAWPYRQHNVSQMRYESSLLFLAARSDAAVSPPPTLVRFSDSRMPWVGTGARFALSVRELTPIQEISDDSRPYSIFGQRFMTTLRPAASAFAAA